MTTFPFDPHRPVLVFDDMRLTRAFQRDPQRCATLNDYARTTGLTVDDVLNLLGPALERGEIDVEAVGGEIFVHTAPNGRPGRHDAGQVPPNLWELLRRGHDRDEAYALWRVTRDLQAGGWDVEADPQHIPTLQGRQTLLGLRIQRAVIPALILVETPLLAAQHGPLTGFELTGTGLCGVLCERGRLDENVTAVRRWMLGRPARAGLDVLVLEAPRYQPVLLTSDDGGLRPRSVSVAVAERNLPQR